MKRVILFLIIIFSISSIQAQELYTNPGSQFNYKETKRHWSVPAIDVTSYHAKQYRASYMGGCVLGLIAYAVAESHYGELEASKHDTELSVAILAGFDIGSTLGVYILGKTKGDTGKIFYTFLGGTIGALVGAPVLVKADGYGKLFGVVIAFTTTSVGTVIGYNLSRDSDYWGVINIDSSGVKSGMPMLSMTTERTWLNQKCSRIDMRLVSIKL